MRSPNETRDSKRTRFSLSQEIITILAVGVALAGLILVNLGEMRADREALHVEARADRARADAAMNLMRTEARADREVFTKQITRLVKQQGTLGGLVAGLRHPVASPVD